MTLPILNVILWKVKSCCCGCTSLRIGTIIIFMLTQFFSILQLYDWFVTDFAPILDYYVLQYAVLGIIVSTCGFIALYGVSNRESSFLLPYIIITAAETVLLWIAMVLTILILFSKERSVDDGARYISEESIDATDSAAIESAMVPAIIRGLVVSVINWYCTSVVYSYYEQLKSKEESDQGSAPR